MFLKHALILSVVLQFAAFIFTISLIPRTRFSIAWISISIGFLLMAVRRLFEVIYFFEHFSSEKFTGINSWIAVVISVAMLIAAIFIRRIFEVMNRIQNFRRENEARMLSAVLSAEEEERRHFARELHEGLGPILSATKMTLSAVEKSSISAPNSDILTRAENMVDSAIVTTREISNLLTPHILERYGLKKAIETFISQVNLNQEIKIDLSSNLEKKRLRPELEVMIYRICCELINNTIKYASASRASLLVAFKEDQLIFKYDDNGIGFKPEEVQLRGMGLTNIRSRVKALQGTVEMKTALKKGFYMSIKLPL